MHDIVKQIKPSKTNRNWFGIDMENALNILPLSNYPRRKNEGKS